MPPSNRTDADDLAVAVVLTLELAEIAGMLALRSGRQHHRKHESRHHVTGCDAMRITWPRICIGNVVASKSGLFASAGPEIRLPAADTVQPPILSIRTL
jgi:hypothetical protein